MKPISQCRILIVDDLEENLWIAEDLLRDSCLVTTLQEGRRTLELAVACHPDIILLDVVMPGTDGFALCRALKQDPRTAHIPVIFLTSLDDTDSRLEGFEAGGVDYVTKPFHSGEVKARVFTHLRLALMEQDLQDNVRHLSRSLESTEENYLFIARSSTDVLMKLDADRNIVFINPIWTEMTGVEASAMTGSAFSRIAIEEDAAALASAFADAIASGAGEARMQFRIAGRLDLVWVRASLRLIRDGEGGTFLGATAILSDISDLIEQSEGLQLTKEGIEEAHSESMENLGRKLCTQLNEIFSGLQCLLDEGLGNVEGMRLLRQGYEKISALATVLIGQSVAKPEAASRVSNRLPAGYAGPVLLVDDSAINLRLLQHMLRKMGFESIDLAYSGAEGISLWQERQHALVLLDIQMPEIDGLEVCKRIRAGQGATPPVVLAVSASLLPGDRGEREACGFDWEIDKPVNLESLSNALSYLGR